MEFLQEKINPQKYNSQIESLYGKLRHMLVNEIDLKKVVQVFRVPDTGAVSSMEIRAKTNINDRLKWKNGKEGKVAGTLSCEEVIELNDYGAYVRTFYSFHFEADASSDVKTFRIDFKPDQLTPLHAHANDYFITQLHLTFPHETSLDLPHIDFCTIMLVISFYMKHKDKYPLLNGSDYNPRIIRKRRRYDEYGKH